MRERGRWCGRELAGRFRAREGWSGIRAGSSGASRRPGVDRLTIRACRESVGGVSGLFDLAFSGLVRFGCLQSDPESRRAGNADQCLQRVTKSSHRLECLRRCVFRYSEFGCGLAHPRHAAIRATFRQICPADARKTNGCSALIAAKKYRSNFIQVKSHVVESVANFISHFSGLCPLRACGSNALQDRATSLLFLSA